MPRTDEGEFELVLGNRQLLSVFFIVVVLLGVFFVMGYILGKNAGPAAGVEVASARKAGEGGASAEPLVVDRTSEKPSPTAALPAPVIPAAKAPEVAKETPKESPKTAAPPAKEAPKPEVKQAAAAPPKEGPVGEPAKGSLFLQVAAVGRPEGEVVAKVLRSKGFKVLVAPVGDNKTFRVLVGPLERADLGKSRSDLTSLGFNPFPRSF